MTTLFHVAFRETLLQIGVAWLSSAAIVIPQTRNPQGTRQLLTSMRGPARHVKLSAAGKTASVERISEISARTIYPVPARASKEERMRKLEWKGLEADSKVACIVSNRSIMSAQSRETLEVVPMHDGGRSRSRY